MVATAAPAAGATKNALRRLQALGQSIWLDNISRGLIRSGALQRLVDEGLLGVTSNPTIFEKAIAGSGDYDDQLATLARQRRPPQEIFEALAIQDIRTAAVANAKIAYERFERILGSPRFAALQARGARVQRVLWGSTSTKNPAYNDTKYVDPLIG